MSFGPPGESLRLVHELAQCRSIRLHDDERPRFRIEAGRVVLEAGVRIVQPGAVPVFVSARDRLILLREDQEHPALAYKMANDRFDARYECAPRIGSSNSEDAVTWSFLRTLEVRGPRGWFRRAMVLGLERAGNPDRVGELPDADPRFEFWRRLPPPPGYPVREGSSEIDALGSWPDGSLISIEAKLGAGLSAGTRYAADRNQFVRNIDVVSWLAHGDRAPGYWPALLLPAGAAETIAYARRLAGDPERLVSALPHRDPGECRVLAGRIAVMTWEDLLEVAGGQQ